MKMDIKKIYEKYVTLHIPNPFTLEQIDERLKKKYLAKKVDIKWFSDFKKDPYADYDTVIAAYIFRNKEGVKRLQILDSPEEKSHFRNDFFYGGGCNLILNSKDKVHLSGFTTQVATRLLDIETKIFCGIRKKDMVLEGEVFNDYLKALYLARYIEFENDPLIEEAYQRYRDGYRLRWYGLTSGESTF